MLRRFLKDSLVYGASSALARGIALALVPFYTRVLAPADLGVIDLIAVIGNLANLVLAIEISQAVARYYPPATSDQRIGYASTALWFTIVTYSIALGIGALAVAPLADWVFDAPGQEGVIAIALPAMWANGVFYFLQNQLRWQLQVREYAYASLIFAITSAALAVVLILYADLGIAGVFWGQLTGAVVASGYCLRACTQSLRLRVDREKLGSMLGFSAPLMISSVAALAATYADRIIIKELMSVSDLGMYVVAQRLAATISFALVGFQATITPLVTHYAGDATTPAQLARVFRYFLAVALPALLGLGVYSRELIVVFATPAYAAVHTLIPILAGAVLLAGMYVFVPGLWLARKTGVTMAINLTAAALSIILNLALIPEFGLAGAAVATLLAAGAGFGAHVTLSRRYFPVPAHWMRALAVLPLLLGMIWMSALLGEPAPGALAARTALFVCGAGALAAAMLGSSELRRILAELPRVARRA